jgi:hypothetical protein
MFALRSKWIVTNIATQATQLRKHHRVVAAALAAVECPGEFSALEKCSIAMLLRREAGCVIGLLRKRFACCLEGLLAAITIEGKHREY